MFTGIKENEVFVDNYSKLTAILKLSFKNMMPHFITERIISPEENSAKVEDLLEKIAIYLKDGCTKHFYTMLKIMKEYGNSSDEELAIAMEKNLSLKQ